MLQLALTYNYVSFNLEKESIFKLQINNHNKQLSTATKKVNNLPVLSWLPLSKNGERSNRKSELELSCLSMYICYCNLSLSLGREFGLFL